MDLTFLNLLKSFLWDSNPYSQAENLKSLPLDEGTKSSLCGERSRVSTLKGWYPHQLDEEAKKKWLWNHCTARICSRTFYAYLPTVLWSFSLPTRFVWLSSPDFTADIIRLILSFQAIRLLSQSNDDRRPVNQSFNRFYLLISALDRIRTCNHGLQMT